jgi:hypothetical protein
MDRQDTQDNGKQVTPAAEFRKGREQGEVVTLAPTGRVVRMRTVKPRHMLQLGEIPDILAELVIKVLYGQMTPEEYRDFFALSERKEHALALTESLRVVCTAALIEPRIVENPQADDEIGIDDLEDGEQRIVFDLALLEASALSRFRARQETTVEPVDDGQGDAQPAEPVGGGEDPTGSVPF